jgi:hypothetical protein
MSSSDAGLDQARLTARITAAEREVTHAFDTPSSDGATPTDATANLSSPTEAAPVGGSVAHASLNPQFPAAAAHLPDESDEERAFILDLQLLDPSSLDDTQKSCLCNVVACLLPKAPVLSSAHANIGSDEHIAAQLGLSPTRDGSSCPVPTTWELRFLLLLLQYLSLEPLTLVALQPLLGMSVDPSPFLQQLGWESFHDRMRCALLLLHFSVVALGGYDARVRTLLRTICGPRLLNLPWRLFLRQENRYAALLAAQAERAKLEEHQRKKTEQSAKIKKYVKVGVAGVVAGGLLFVTGGLAAPAIGAGLASLGLGGSVVAGSSVFLASSAGIFLVASVFGATGAGLIGYKLNRRISGLKEFRFERLSGVSDGTNVRPVTVEESTETQGSMSVHICINGWLNSMEDYHRIWQCMPPGRVVCGALAEEDEEIKRKKQTKRTLGNLLRREDKEVKEMQKKGAGASASSGSASASAASASAVTSPTECPSYTPGLAEHAELYTLRWESDCLLRFGEGLKDISGKDVATSVASVGLQQTVLKGLVLAIAWPVTLLQAGDIVDHPCKLQQWTLFYAFTSCIRLCSLCFSSCRFVLQGLLCWIVAQKPPLSWPTLSRSASQAVVP